MQGTLATILAWFGSRLSLLQCCGPRRVVVPHHQRHGYPSRRPSPTSRVRVDLARSTRSAACMAATNMLSRCWKMCSSCELRKCACDQIFMFKSYMLYENTCTSEVVSGHNIKLLVYIRICCTKYMYSAPEVVTGLMIQQTEWRVTPMFA